MLLLNGHGSITNFYNSCVEMTSWGKGSWLSTRVSLALLFGNDGLLKRYSCWTEPNLWLICIGYIRFCTCFMYNAIGLFLLYCHAVLAFSSFTLTGASLVIYFLVWVIRLYAIYRGNTFINMIWRKKTAWHHDMVKTESNYLLAIAFTFYTNQFTATYLKLDCVIS